MIIKNEFLFVGGHFPPKTRNVCHKIIPRIRLSLTHTQHTHTHKTHNTHTHTHTQTCASFGFLLPASSSSPVTIPSYTHTTKNMTHTQHTDIPTQHTHTAREVTRSQGRSKDHQGVTHLCFFWISPPSLFLVPRHNPLINKRKITRSQGRSQDHKITRSQGRHAPVLLSSPVTHTERERHTHSLRGGEDTRRCCRDREGEGPLCAPRG
jgi:hypothetical protein